MPVAYIAIIDDDEDDVSLLKESFQQINPIPIKIFPTGQSFLKEEINDRVPCLLIVDLNLPDINGLDLIEQIKSNSSLEKVPIIIYTSGYTPIEKQTCKQLEIDVIRKPSTVKEWDEIVKKLAEKCAKIL